MASTGKKKTTMAKLSRESRLRERRLDKQARKQARKEAAANPAPAPEEPQAASDNPADADAPNAADSHSEPQRLS